MWIDEAYSITDAMAGAGWWGMPDTNFPLGLWGIRASLEAFGRIDEWTARFVPACAGSLAPAALAWALSSIMGRRRALAAGLFLALHPWHVQWSQNARAYAPMVLFLIVFLGCSLRAARQRGHGFVWAGGGALTIAALTHPTALLPAAGLLLPGISRRWRDHLRRPVLWLAAMAGLALVAGPAWEALRTHMQQKGSPSPVLYGQTVAWFGNVPFLALAALSAVAGWKGRDRTARFLAESGWGALVLGFAASLLFRVNAQYVLGALPALCGLAGRIVPESGDRGREARTRWGMCVVALAALAVQTSLYFGPYHGVRGHWREACAYVWAHREPSDIVVSNQAPVAEFYLGQRTEVRKGTAVRVLGPQHSGERLDPRGRVARRDVLHGWEAGSGRIWLIVNESVFDDWPEADRRRIRKRLSEEATVPFERPLRMAGKDLTVKVFLLEG